MRKRLRLGLALGLALALGACAPIRNYGDLSGPRYAGGVPRAEHAAGLRFVTFNIQFAQQVTRAIELLRSSDALRDADVIALQEMDEDGVARIADALGMAYVYYPAALRQTGKDFGNAVLVRGQIEADHKLVLPRPGRFGGMQRIAVAVTARVAGQRLRIYSTHLGTPKDISSSSRREQVAAIVADVANGEGPVLVAGDFNNRDVVAEAFQRAGFTWATGRVGHTISLFSWDHVFLKGFGEGVSPKSGAVDNRGASDHRPVWVELPPAARDAARSGA